MKLTIASKEAVKMALTKYHYAKRMTPARISFSVFEGEVFCGVICYGVGANRFVGEGIELVQGRFLELLRVALNGKQSSTSKAVAISLKLLKKYKPCCKMVVSYADIDQEHKGVIYQATNWYYLGETAKGAKKYKKGRREIHNRIINNIRNKKDFLVTKSKGKRKYVYILDKKDKELRSKVDKLKKEYPK